MHGGAAAQVRIGHRAYLDVVLVLGVLYVPDAHWGVLGVFDMNDTHLMYEEFLATPI